METKATTFHRRRLVGGALAGAVAASAVAGLSRAAQEDPATPGTGSDTTPGASTSTTGRQDRAVAAMIERATAVIASVTADRDAVADQIDTTTVDDLLDRARSLVEQAQASDSMDGEGSLRRAGAAIGIATTSQELLEARLTYPGLPSQEAPASQVLATAYDRVDAQGGQLDATSTDDDTSFLLTTAQGLYGEAHDLYGAGAFNQAAETGATAARVAMIAGFLSGEWEPRGMPNGRGMDGSWHDAGHRGGMGQGRWPGDAADPGSEEPVTVPTPTF